MKRTISRQQKQAVEGTCYRIKPYSSKYFALCDTCDESLVGVFVYLKGAANVVKLLTKMECGSLATHSGCNRGRHNENH